MATVFRHTSITKGVSWHKPSKRWLGRFTVNGQRHYVGSFKEEAEAAKAVNRARIDLMTSSSLRHEVKNELKEEKIQINKNAPYMSPVQEWTTLTLGQLKHHAEKHGIVPEDVVGDKRIKKTWIDVLAARDVRPITAKEPEIASSIEEIEGLLDYLDKDEQQDRHFSDAEVLNLPEEEWASCVVINPEEPAYFWVKSGFLYTLYPAEGYTVWRYDQSVPGNYKPIGVWNGPEMDEDENHLDRPWQVSVDKEAGTYCKIEKEEPEEGEILENWDEDALISRPLSEHRNHS